MPSFLISSLLFARSVIEFRDGYYFPATLLFVLGVAIMYQGTPEKKDEPK